MTFRIRLVITAAVVLLVISQLLAADTAPALAIPRFSFPVPMQTKAAEPGAPCAAGLVQTDTKDKNGQPITICSVTQEKAGDIYKLHQRVEVRTKTYVLAADDVTYDNSSGLAEAVGHVHLTGGAHDEDVRASRAKYNVRDETGRFEDVEGSIGLARTSKHLYLTTTNPFLFRGKIVDKTSPDHYIVHQGRVTVCDSPTPAWSLSAGRAVVEVGEDAQMYHSTFRLHNVPVFYLPYATHPVDSVGRQSGFLIPTIGQSSVKGFTFGESYYWAVNRSTDATIGAEYFSRRGFAQHGNFRWRPSEDAFVEARYFGVLDRLHGAQNQGGEDFNLAAEGMLAHDIRAVANIEYLSSYLFRLAFNETFATAVNSEVRSTAFFSKMSDGYFFNLDAQRYQNFESTAHGDLVTILHAPGIELSSADHKLRKTPFVWSYETAVEGVSRTEPGFTTDPLVGRFDLTPRLSAPTVFHGWSFRPEVALRETYYTQRVQPNGSIGTPVDAAVNRRAIEGAFELRPPAVGRIFERKVFGRTLKHTMEPRATWRYVNGIENFNQIIRFDARDIVSDTNEVEYGIVNRLYAKRSAPTEKCPAAEDQPVERDDGSQPVQPPPDPECAKKSNVREIVTWEVAQKSFFVPDFGGAVVNGRRNVLTTTADFTGIAFLTEPRSWSPLISRLRLNTSENTGLQWNLDYDGQKGRINASTVLADWHMGNVFLGGSHAFLHVPGEIFTSPASAIVGPDRFNQFRVMAGYGHPNKRGISIAGNIGFDSNFNFLQYANSQVSYNWDCMGLTVEYRRLALGSVRNENVFRFALSLANIGTFGTLRRQERLF
jgi:LPS-assembly protein